MYDGAAQLSSAIKSLKEGLSDYKNGVSELRGGTNDIDSEVSSQIDKLLKEISGNDEVKSFVSDKNTDVASVQFVLKTDAIEPLEEDIISTSNEKSLTFWNKLLALFGIE